MPVQKKNAILVPVDSDEPVFGGVGLLQIGEVDVFVADDSVTSAVMAGGSAVVQLWTQTDVQHSHCKLQIKKILIK